MQFSDFGNKFRRGTGIGALMQDLSAVPSDGLPLYRLGGGNPALIPAASKAFRQYLHALANHSKNFDKVYCHYASAQGESEFLHTVAELLNRTYDWSLTSANIALTNGSQNAFFMLFNLFAGVSKGKTRTILLPMAPEYFGYQDVSIGAPFFVSHRPQIEHLDAQTFKYRLDTDQLQLDHSVAALCVSRPTNPTGNVLSDAEIASLDKLARDYNIPLIIDNAYGAPFQNIIHVPATLHWHNNIILSMSLSKLGLPAARTGIVVARPDIIELLTQMNAVLNLSPISTTASMLQPMFANDEVLSLCEQHIRPYYAQRAVDARGWFREAFAGLPALMHKAEGAIFLWIWFPELAITTAELYQRLKLRGVIVVPGHYFFPGMDDNWSHKQQCIRVNIAGDPDELKIGLKLIADEVRLANHHHTR